MPKEQPLASNWVSYVLRALAKWHYSVCYTHTKLFKMKILNLYSGLGGNRKLWGNYHDITAVEIDPEVAKIYQKYFPSDNMVVGDAHQYLLDNFEQFDFIWGSPPCPSHSRMNTMLYSFKDSRRKKYEYPDMKLYRFNS